MKEKIIEILEDEIMGYYKPEYYSNLADRILSLIEKKCVWAYHSPEPTACIGYHLTSCGVLTELKTSGDFNFDEITFCPYCGGVIQIEGESPEITTFDIGWRKKEVVDKLKEEGK